MTHLLLILVPVLSGGLLPWRGRALVRFLSRPLRTQPGLRRPHRMVLCSLADLVHLGGGRFASGLTLADALVRTGQLIALGGGQSIARASERR